MSEPRYKSVLLIDDNEIDNFTNKKLIENNAFCAKVQVANSGRAALDMLKSLSAEELPEIVFLDIMMPVMDGFEFLEQFAGLSEEIQKRCKIIMLSTSESFKDLNRANKNAFVYKFLNKPLSDPMLSAINI